MAEVEIYPASAADAGEILTVQRAAYVSEALLYGDLRLPALTQTLDELVEELAGGMALKAVIGSRLVGAVRARLDGAVLRIGRLTVVPDLQGRGIGTQLLHTLEDRAADVVSEFALFTGHLSIANLRLYERLGYRETHRETLHPGVDLVHLVKPGRAVR